MHRTHCITVVGLLVVLFSLLSTPLAAGEREINAAWRGAWVITRIATDSNCDGRFTNNEVSGDLVSSDGRWSFGRGEIGRVEKINLNRKRIEVFVELVEPLLNAYQDGPFDLYDEVFCKIELRIARPAGDDNAFNAAIATALERHASDVAAQASPEWNRRRREAYPEDYDQTVAEYQTWRAAQFNAAVQAELSESVTEAARLVRRIDTDSEYLDGFGAGIEHARHEYFSDDCERLLSMTRSGFVDKAPKQSPNAYGEGYEEAQALFFHVERAERLRGCFLAPPPGLAFD